MRGCYTLASPFLMASSQLMDALRQLDLNYILYVAERNNSKCEHKKPEGWFEGYHKAVEDLSHYLEHQP